MKILPIENIREADAYTIEHEPISDIDLMERAATELFEWVEARTNPELLIRIFCGPGNNGGDGFVLGRLLHEAGREVKLYLLRFGPALSPSCQKNFERAENIKSLAIHEISEEEQIPEMGEGDLVVDAIFGSGLTRPVTGLVAGVVDAINDAGALTIAVDAPSGFFCDKTNIGNEGSIIRADYTLTFQFPKLGFLFPENEKFVGRWEVLPIGLHPAYTQKVEVRNHYLTTGTCRKLHKPRKLFSHKGTFGHGLLIAGSYGKMGAAVLAAKAGLKAGSGLITTHIPRSGDVILQSSVPAAMVSHDADEHVFSGHPELAPYNAIAVGPGLGSDEKTETALKLLIQNSALPLIFDADALNILAVNKTWLSFIRPGSIYTPHPKEFERLVGPSRDNFERNQLQREFSVKYQAYVILKGAHTCISTPDGICYFNSTGNPGMATGGSGDVLTGILLGLMAQGYTPLATCLMGVYLHGLAGDLAADKWGYEALTAGNITHNLGKAFQKITH